VLSINGNADNVTRYAGDLANADGWGAYLSVDEIVNLWIEQANVEKSASKVLDFSGDDSIALDHYTTYPGSPERLHYRVEGGGHDWPGARFAWWDLRRLVSAYAMGFGEHRGFDASAKITEFFNENK
jgi:poly(3-hydroxybutyrate) depolymerase